MAKSYKRWLKLGGYSTESGRRELILPNGTSLPNAGQAKYAANPRFVLATLSKGKPLTLEARSHVPQETEAVQSVLTAITGLGVLYSQQLFSDVPGVADFPRIDGFTPIVFDGEKSWNAYSILVGGYRPEPLAIEQAFTVSATFESPTFTGTLIPGEYGDFVSYSGTYSFTQTVEFTVTGNDFRMRARASEVVNGSGSGGIGGQSLTSITIQPDVGVPGYFETTNFEDFAITDIYPPGHYVADIYYEIFADGLVEYYGNPDSLNFTFRGGVTVATEGGISSFDGALLSADTSAYYISLDESAERHYTALETVTVTPDRNIDWRITNDSNCGGTLNSYLTDPQANYIIIDSTEVLFRVPDADWTAYQANPTQATLNVERFVFDGSCDLVSEGVQVYDIYPLPTDESFVNLQIRSVAAF